MALTTLVDSETLARRLGDPGWALIDCRFMLEDGSWGEREYEAGHIPGAAYAHLDRDLSGPRDGTNGRHPLPSVPALTQTFGRLGIDRSIQVIAYDQDGGMYASRLWWLLRWLEHDAVAVLDGGLAKWTAEGRPTAIGRESRRPRVFSGTPRRELAASAGDVAALSGTPGWRLVDARAPERYRGEIEPVDKVPGHIPGAVNYFFKESTDGRGLMRPAAELRQRLDEAIGGVEADHVVCYCGSGVTACHTLLALEHAGFHGARLYPGSWSEWSSDPTRPIAAREGKPGK